MNSCVMCDTDITDLVTQVLCSMCSVPGHATIVHTTGDFATRKLVVDTFGWLSFKHWFLEVLLSFKLLSFVTFLSRLSSESGGLAEATVGRP